METELTYLRQEVEFLKKIRYFPEFSW